ncbi:hypothetical protein E0L93_00135 [Rubrobacter taiwanensis]|uniref:Uncharacterized protein n=1 Tax=Rubrobacter taiwanensis TaxID=185139 RepID=A0A4R1BTQ8_9ACTN|nr:hypothetical protein [Rubrobacter taiwanensis]TCJ20676.1 hypothetical protein E0L93_00135 [Rubrobacter taiwanensis]
MPSALEIRLCGGLLALNRLSMTLQNKRMPVEGLTLARNGAEVRVTVVLDCEGETARRYAALLSGLEDVSEAGVVADLEEVALVRADGRCEAVSGSPEYVERWLAENEVEDAVRLGPVARPGKGAC